jgi:UPF0716 protein FxsA
VEAISMSMAFPMRLALVLYIVAEVALFVLVGRWVGGGALFLWVLATAAAGAVLVRREGMRAVETMRVAMRERRAPERPVPGRGMVATGGLLLVLPGLLTDLVGLVMVLPVTRPVARRLASVLGTAVVGRTGGVTVRSSQPAPKRTPGPVVRGEVLESRDDPAD